jgi:uncharacterized protein (TIGR00255 family)
MIRSMTGFASVVREDEQATINVTLRAVNHRYLDLQIRLPQSAVAMESDLRALIGERITRGRIEANVALQLRREPAVEVKFNEEFGRALAGAIEEARDRGLVAGALTPGDLLRLPQALAIRERANAGDDAANAALAASIREVFSAALTDLDAMRVREGGHLRADLEERRTLLAGLVERIALAADEGREAMELRLTTRIRDLRADVQADETAVAQEIVRWAGRSDISEEVERFRGHLAHWAALVESAEPCGRKLDFLLQEMNREVNTMGSKADGLSVSELIISAKAELEKMREQVQNAE